MSPPPGSNKKKVPVDDPTSLRNRSLDVNNENTIPVDQPVPVRDRTAATPPSGSRTPEVKNAVVGKQEKGSNTVDDPTPVCKRCMGVINGKTTPDVHTPSGSRTPEIKNAVVGKRGKAGNASRIPVPSAANNATRIPVPSTGNGNATRIPVPSTGNGNATRIPVPSTGNGNATRIPLPTARKASRIPVRKLHPVPDYDAESGQGRRNPVSTRLFPPNTTAVGQPNPVNRRAVIGNPITGCSNMVSARNSNAGQRLPPPVPGYDAERMPEWQQARLPALPKFVPKKSVEEQLLEAFPEMALEEEQEDDQEKQTVAERFLEVDSELLFHENTRRNMLVAPMKLLNTNCESMLAFRATSRSIWKVVIKPNMGTIPPLGEVKVKVYIDPKKYEKGLHSLANEKLHIISCLTERELLRKYEHFNFWTEVAETIVSHTYIEKFVVDGMPEPVGLDSELPYVGVGLDDEDDLDDRVAQDAGDAQDAAVAPAEDDDPDDEPITRHEAVVDGFLSVGAWFMSWAHELPELG